MKATIKLILIILTLGGIYSCNSNGTNMSKPEKGKLETINIKDLQPNAIVHEKLSEEQISRITNFQEILREVNMTPIEKTIENFQRDLNPDEEIVVWEHIAKAYQSINEENKAFSLDEKNEIYSLLLYRSMMSKEEVLQQVKLKTLDVEKAKEVISYYEKG